MTQSTLPKSWDDLTREAENPVPRQNTGGFRSQSVREENREVIVMEGRVADKICQTESMAKGSYKMSGDHGTHGIGMQLGENLPEGVTSAPPRFNLSEMKIIENRIREVADKAGAQNATVETKTVLKVEHVVKNNKNIPILVGIDREAWVVFPGSDKTFPFVKFKAEIDLTSNVVNVTHNLIIGRDK